MVVQGTIVAWNPDTFENIIDIDGQRFENVPVASGVEALTYAPGQVVLIEKWFPGGKKGELGLGTAWIRGRIITPGTGAAEQAVAFMTTSLGKAISRSVFAEGILSADEAGSVSTASTSFVALTGGPELSDIEITATGKAIVLTTAHINSAAIGDTESTHGGVMSFQVTGATSVAPGDFLAVSSGGAKGSGSADAFDAAWNRSSSLTLVEGLNPGLHTFTARYRTRDANSVDTTFFNRNITVFAF
jgi:hypothetical protein